MANNVVTFNPAQLPTFARKRSGQTSALAKALAGGGGGGYPRKISIKGGVFRLIADGKEVAAIEERYLDVVIVDAAPKISRAYYKTKFKDSESSAPVCWSDDGVTPDATVAAPQATACASCPMNVKGSGDGDTRACRHNQRIAVVLANDIGGDILQMTVPGKSLFGKEDNGRFPLKAYATWLQAANIEPNEVVTRMRFDTKEEHPKIQFKTQRWLEDSEYATVEQQAESDKAKAAVAAPKYSSQAITSPAAKPPSLPAPASDDDDDEAAPPPKAEKPKKAKPAPAAADDDDDDTPPTVRKQPEAPKMPERKPLASVVADWDTDD